MKKYWISSLVYGGVGLALGVYFREFTKFNGFDGRTSLAFAHPHALILGALVFLALFFLSKRYRFAKPKLGKATIWIYHVGLAWTLLMMAVRGTLTVLGTEARRRRWGDRRRRRHRAHLAWDRHRLVARQRRFLEESGRIGFPRRRKTTKVAQKTIEKRLPIS